MTPAEFARAAVAAAGRLVWPPACLVCDRDLGPAGDHFCDACRTALVTDPGDKCPWCASPVGPYTDLEDFCPRCRTEQFHFVGAVRLGTYEGVLRDAVLAMKYPAGEVLAGRLGELWAAERRDELLQGDPQIVAPVPLHWRRRLRRGYNQAEELARGVARTLALPCPRRLLWRTRHTPMQSQMESATARRANLSGAFSARRSVAGVRVLLVDDVMTTGATLDGCAAALLACGAAQVRAAVVAHR